MAIIFHLPEKLDSLWGVYERDLRKLLEDGGYQHKEIEPALRALKPIWMEASKVYDITDKDPQKLFYLIDDWVRKQVGTLLFEVVLREIELNSLRKPRGGPHAA